MIRCQRVRARKLEVSAASSGLLGRGKMAWRGIFCGKKSRFLASALIMGGKTARKTEGRFINNRCRRMWGDPIIRVRRIILWWILQSLSTFQSSIPRASWSGSQYLCRAHPLGCCPVYTNLLEVETNYGHMSALPNWCSRQCNVEMIPWVLQEMSANTRRGKDMGQHLGEECS